MPHLPEGTVAALPDALTHPTLAKPPKRRWVYGGIAAGLLLVIGLGFYQWFNTRSDWLAANPAVIVCQSITFEQLTI